MSNYKLENRKQRITDLISSFSVEKTSPAKPVYLIDRSFHHAEIDGMSPIEKKAISRTIDTFVQR
jgi:hypothetical protein